MPRPGPRRPLVAFRLSGAEVGDLDALANHAGVTRSDVIRALISAALKTPAALDEAGAQLRETRTDRTV